MATVTIDRPGVEVIQEFLTVSPTVLKPTMPGCVVGACFQVVEAVKDDGSLNSDSVVTTAGRLNFSWVSSPFEYAAVGGETLGIEVNNGAEQTVTFGAGPNLTADEVADEINEAAITGLMAIVEESGSQKRVVLYTTAKGDNASLRVGASTTAAVLNAFGITSGYKVPGRSGYTNYYELRMQFADYPDPRGNLDELDVDWDTVRVFIADGSGSYREVLKTETFLRGATSAVTVADDGDGDNLSPYLNFAGEDFSAAPAAAQATGNADLTLATYANIQNRVLRMSIDGDDPQTLTFSAGVSSAAGVVNEINALWGTGVATLSGNNLQLNSLLTNGGRESVIRIDKNASDATLLTELGLTSAGAPFENTDVVYGSPFKPVVGDEVWVDGVKIGAITEVPVSPTNRLRVDTEQLLSFTGATWYIIAKALDNGPSTATRPASDLIIDENSGTVLVKHELFRETDGNSVKAGPLTTYLAYTALRKDVSPVGEDFSLLRFGTTTSLEDELSPIDTQNPLGLGLYFAILNAPGLEMTGLGVEATSDTEPDGTLSAYTKAFEFLESKDVYAIAPLTHSNDVGQVAQVHVDELSEPENGLERLVILNPSRPTRKADTLVASGATGNVSGAPTDIFETGIANLQNLLAAAGKPGPTFTEEDGVFLEMENDTNKYLIQSVSGGQLTINDGPLSASNTFFYDAAGGNVFSEAVVDRPFSVKIRGAAITTLTEEATAYAAIAQGYKDRRVIVTAPDQAKATIDGLESVIDGYYLAAALAGKIASKNPSQPLTEESLVGFSGLIGSNDRYGEIQLKIMSGGGLFVFYHEEGKPVKIRHQLTSDMSSLEKRELSILTALDFGAKFIRAGVRNFIGRFNVSTNIQDAISVVIDGLGRWLVKERVFRTFEAQALRQDADSPDTLELDADIGVFYPLNKLRVRMVI